MLSGKWTRRPERAGVVSVELREGAGGGVAGCKLSTLAGFQAIQGNFVCATIRFHLESRFSSLIKGAFILGLKMFAGCVCADKDMGAS